MLLKCGIISRSLVNPSSTNVARNILFLGCLCTWWPLLVLPLFHVIQLGSKILMLLWVTQIPKSKQSLPKTCNYCNVLVLVSLSGPWPRVDQSLPLVASNSPSQTHAPMSIISMGSATPSTTCTWLGMMASIFGAQLLKWNLRKAPSQLFIAPSTGCNNTPHLCRFGLGHLCQDLTFIWWCLHETCWMYHCIQN